MGFGFGFGLIEALFPILFLTMFVVILSVFVVTLVRSVGQWNRNNHSPVLTVDATVVAKRTAVGHHHNSSSHTHHTYTHYYATFQVESGDRMELALDGQEYGMLAEGDRGRLTFQGTRYHGFQRT